MSVDANALTRTYVKIRDARAALKKTFDAEDQVLKAKLDRLEAEMLRVLNETNTESVATDSGTFYRQENMVPSGADWEAFYRWVSEHQAFDALEKRIKKTFVQDWMDGHDGTPPPGVNVYREFVVRVRRS
jgi:hypothetical protein